MIDREWSHRQIGKARRWQERAVLARRAAAAAGRGDVAAADAAWWAPWARRANRVLASADRVNRTWRIDVGGDRPDPIDGPLVAWRVAMARCAMYAEARAKTIALPRSAIVAACGKRRIAFRCGCGTSSRTVGCGQVILCDECRRPFYKRIRRRALAAVTARLADAVTSWARAGRRRGRRPAIVLVTLTIPRKVDGRDLTLAERFERLRDGWKRMRTWLHGRAPTGSLKSDRGIGAFPFVLLPEITAGSDGTGHLHYHAVCIWPWWDWRRAQAQWRRSTGLSDANPPDMRVVHEPKRAAHYVAKYATKGANVDGEGMTPELMADFLCTFYGKRRVTPSHGFWCSMDRPRCPCCGERLVVTDRPGSIADACQAWDASQRVRGSPWDAIWTRRRDWKQYAAPW